MSKTFFTVLVFWLQLATTAICYSAEDSPLVVYRNVVDAANYSELAENGIKISIEALNPTIGFAAGNFQLTTRISKDSDVEKIYYVKESEVSLSTKIPVLWSNLERKFLMTVGIMDLANSNLLFSMRYPDSYEGKRRSLFLNLYDLAKIQSKSNYRLQKFLNEVQSL